MPDNILSDYNFWPEAMLPAWLVTDHNLIIRKCNDFASELLESVSKAELLIAPPRLSIDISDFLSNDIESLWECILDEKDLSYIKEALRILKVHIFIIKEFNKNASPNLFESLVEQLREVKGQEDGVTPYVYRPKPNIFRIGVKVSPPQGLKLKRRTFIEGAYVEYIDIVIAYRLKAELNENLISQFVFYGVQPAIHDATERHHLWQKWRAEELENVKVKEQTQITQFLSHAFKTPMLNIKSMAGDLQCQGQDYETIQELSKQLTSNVDDLSNLSDLILFINTSEFIKTTLCASMPKDLLALQVTFEEVEEVIAKTLSAVMNGKNLQDKKKVQLLAELKEGEQPDGNFAYAEIAKEILDRSSIEGISCFYIGIENLKSSQDSGGDIIEKVRTTFLNLILSELLLNAIKYADQNQPKVKIILNVNDAGNHLVVNVINNGTELKEGEFNNVLRDLAMKPGEKRRALGLELNKQAARILRWELTWVPPEEKGTNLSLSIPFRN